MDELFVVDVVVVGQWQWQCVHMYNIYKKKSGRPKKSLVEPL